MHSEITQNGEKGKWGEANWRKVHQKDPSFSRQKKGTKTLNLFLSDDTVGGGYIMDPFMENQADGDKEK